MKSNHSTIDKKEDDDMPMEDILASIRRYVSEESNGEKATEAFFDENQKEKVPEQNNSTIRLTKEQEIPDPSSKTLGQKKEDQSLLSKETHRLSAMAFDKLKKVSEQTLETKKEGIKILEESATLDAFVRGTVEKCVQIWLDEHLPRMVEEMIAQEIEKIKNPSL